MVDYPEFTKEQDVQLDNLLLLFNCHEYSQITLAGGYRPKYEHKPWDPYTHLPCGLHNEPREVQDAIQMGWRQIYGDPSLPDNLQG